MPLIEEPLLLLNFSLAEVYLNYSMLILFFHLRQLFVFGLQRVCFGDYNILHSNKLIFPRLGLLLESLQRIQIGLLAVFDESLVDFLLLINYFLPLLHISLHLMQIILLCIDKFLVLLQLLMQ